MTPVLRKVVSFPVQWTWGLKPVLQVSYGESSWSSRLLTGWGVVTDLGLVTTGLKENAMKNPIRTKVAMTIVAVAASSVFAFAQSEPPVRDYRGVPVLLIRTVEQIDNLDKGDLLGKNNADFYAIVTVNGVKTTTKVQSGDFARPYWQVPLDMTTRYSDVTIRVMEDDGGLEGKDDHADVNPFPNRKDIRFWYDRSTGRVMGDVRGGLNETFIFEGGGDDSRARITFMVYKD